MNCPNPECNEPVEADWDECPYCEAPLPKRCAQCGREINERMRKCPRCKTPLTPSAIESEQERQRGPGLEPQAMGTAPDADIGQPEDVSSAWSMELGPASVSPPDEPHEEALVDVSQGSAQWSLEARDTTDEAEAAEEPTGTPLSERYEVLEQVGRGGFAVVYKARDTKLDRAVAVKRLLPEQVTGSQATQTIERFTREARAIAGLNHRNIVQVFDHDRDAEGYYIVMEYVEGGSLRDCLKERGKLPVEEAIKLIKGIGQGLSVAHRRNLVHRDIKPANILLASEGEEVVPRIVDFGLARAGPDSSTSVSGYGLGTPFYMPPEQRRDAKSVNHTADIYALGKTLYEMVTGEVPDNVDPETIPPPPDLAKVILRCIKSRPEERYFSVDEMLRELDALLEGAAVSDAPVTAKDKAAGNVCPDCGTGNPEDVKFCESCGTGLTRICPECERENSVHKQFCGGCGTDVEGFAQVQDGLQRMEKSQSEKRWSRVTKEFGLLPQEPRLPGEKGRKSLERAQELNGEAEAMLARRDELRQRTQEATDQGQFENALELVAEYREVDPWNDEVNALPDVLHASIDDRDYGKAMQDASPLEEGKRCDEAVLFFEEYLQQHAEGRHVEEARARIAQLKKKHDALQRTRALLDRAGRAIQRAAFPEVEKILHEAASLQMDEGGVARVRSQLDQIRKAYSQHLANCKQAREAGDLEKAGEEAPKALEECPESAEAAKVMEAIKGDKETASQLVAQARTAGRSAQFEDSARCLEQAGGLWSQLESIDQARDELETIRESYNKETAGARHALSERDLALANERAEAALEVCPEAREAKELKQSIVDAQEAVRDLLESAEELVRAADFAEARDKIERARAEWPALAEIEALGDRTGVVQRQYEAEMASARAALGKGDFATARAACERATRACEHSAAAEALSREIGGKKKEARARQVRRRRRLLLVAKLVLGLSLVVAYPAYSVWCNLRYSRYVAAASRALESQDFAAATESAESALRYRRDDSKALRVWHEAGYHQALAAARRALASQDFVVAAEQAQKALEHRPDDADASSLYQETDCLRAISAARTAAAAKAESLDEVVAIWQVLFEQWPEGELADEIRQALEKAQHEAQAWHEAECEKALGKAKQAIEAQDFRSASDSVALALRHRPNDPAALALQNQLIPVLVITSTPSGAKIEFAAPSDHASRMTPHPSPCRIEVEKNTSYVLRFTKKGFRSVRKEVRVAEGGEYSVSTVLEESKLPEGLEAAFEIPEGPKDAHGNPVKLGFDEKTGYPLEIRHKGTGLHLVFIPAGTFQMGSNDGRDDEKPVHKVTLSKPFYLGKYEVTQAEWEKVIGKNPSNFKGDQNPVESVSWDDCQEFLKKLNTLLPLPLGEGYRSRFWLARISFCFTMG